MQVLVFELGGNGYCLRVEDVMRILAPGDGPGEGLETADLGSLLGLKGVAPPGAQAYDYKALLPSGLALRMGAPQGASVLDATWILPLPGYMFATAAVPFRGIVEIPRTRRGGRALRTAHRALLLDPEVLLRHTGIDP